MSVNKIYTANLVITNKCNSKCQSCNYWKIKENSMLDLESIRKYFDVLEEYDTDSVVITGGEPTIHPDFKEIVRMAKVDYGFIVILATNGIGLSKMFPKVRNYVDSYCISMDGYDKESYKKIRGVDDYQNIMDSVKLIRDYNENIQLWLGCLIQYDNYKDLMKIYNSAYESGVNGLFFNVPELNQNCFGRDSSEEKGDKKLYIPLDELEELQQCMEEMVAADQEKGFLCQKEEVVKDFVNYFRIIQDKDCEVEYRKCYLPFNSITLTEKKKMKPCFYLPEEFDFFSPDFDINNEKMNQYRENFFKDHCEICKYCYQFKS